MGSAPLTRRALLASAATLAALPLGVGRRPAHAQTITADTAPRFFRLEYAPGVDRRGRPIVQGYAYLNSSGQGAARMRLLVETLDPAGRPVASRIAHVDEDIVLGARNYFEVRPEAPGAAYRVSVHSAEWVKAGGGSGM
ncbi:MAG TPA: hypothetical protein VJU81_25840 [Methylomirabilota bacterium]|nr:hypothetical protein [Methylomirabilota bacterium]